MKGLIFNLQRFAMTGTSSNDVIRNTVESNDIYAYGGNDSITNTADNASIYAGDGADIVQNNYAEGGDAVYIDGGTGTDRIFNSNNYDATILGGDDNDTIQNSSGSYASINGGYGNDSIYNASAVNVTIDGGAGSDTIKVYRNRNSSINGGAGNDLISLKSSSGTLTVTGGAGNDVIYGDTLKNVGVVYQYGSGEGYDTIYGFKSDKDTLRVTSGSWYTTRSGSDLIYAVGSGSVYLKDYFTSQILYNSRNNVTFNGTANNDIMSNTGTNVMISSGAGNDSIYNGADTVTVNAGDGNDTVVGRTWRSSLNGGAGDDIISIGGGDVDGTTIVGGLGNDTIYGDGRDGYNVYQYAYGDGYDSIYGFGTNDTLRITSGAYMKSTIGSNVLVSVTSGANSTVTSGVVTLSGAAGKNINIIGDTVQPTSTILYNSRNNVTFNGTANNDIMSNTGTNVMISSGAGNDSIYNGADTVTVNAGDGNDTVVGRTWRSSLNGGLGDDIISIGGGDVDGTTIVGGLGNDTIYGDGRDGYNVYQYAYGDGYDTVYSAMSNDTLKITSGSYSTTRSGSDLIVRVGQAGSTSYTGTITFKNLSSINIDASTPTPNSRNNVIFNGTANNDIMSNAGNYVTINSGAGNDSIYNGADTVTVNAGDGNDTVVGRTWRSSLNGGSGDDIISIGGGDVDGTTIVGGLGNDTIYGDGYDGRNTYQYAYGDGYDTVYNASAYDTLKITSGSYSTTRSGSDLIVRVGQAGSTSYTGTITFKNLSSINIDAPPTILYNSRNNVTFNGTANNDIMSNTGTNVMISSGAGNDSIYNGADTVTVNAGDGNDTVVGRTWRSSLNGGAGDDIISIGGGDVDGTTIVGGLGYDTIYGDGYDGRNVYQYAVGDGYDTIINATSNDTLKITAGQVISTQRSGSDLIVRVGQAGSTSYTGAITFKNLSSIDIGPRVLYNSRDRVTFNGTANADIMSNTGNYVTINSGNGNDSIYNGADTVTVDAGAGNDTVVGRTWYSSLNGGAGDDVISIGGGDVDGTTIVGGLGYDTIYGDGYDGRNVYQYAVGDGYDTVVNANSNDTLKITAGQVISSQRSGSDLIVRVGQAGSTSYTGIVTFKNLSSINLDVPSTILYNSRDRVTFNGTANADIMSNTGNYVTINSGNGNDSIYNGADTVTVDAGAGNDTVVGRTWRSSLNGGAGDDVISIGGGDVDGTTIVGGLGYDTIYGDGYDGRNVYQYAVGDGYDTVVNANSNDTLKITAGQVISSQRSGSDLIVRVGQAGSTSYTGTVTFKNLSSINIDAPPVPNPNVSQQDVIKGFMGSLDTTSYSGISAVNQAVSVASGGYFTSAQAVINAMVRDRNNSTNGNNFLLNYCGINLEGRSTEDTGSITGRDAGGTTVKTKESIVPESGSLINFTGNSFTTNGLTVQLVNWTNNDSSSYSTDYTRNLSDVQLQMWQSFYTWWAAGGLNLIAESYGSNYGFTSASSATTKTLKFGFISDDPDALAWTSNRTSSGYLGMAINMDYYSNLSSTNVNGYDPVSRQTYLDRTLAHELTHAVMMANIRNFNSLPTYIVEGMAELTHGIDDERRSPILALVANTTRMQQALVNRTDYFEVNGVDSPSYVGGYTFLRYLAKQGSLHYGETSSSNAPNSANDTTVSIKGAVLTVNDNFNRDTIDLTTYASTVTKVNASKITQDLTIIGNEWANSVKGGAGNDSIYGNSGNDTLLGGAGNDEIYGDAGNNLLKGEAGNDTLFGAGNDTFTGGAGSDLFVYNAEVSGNAVITDYSSSDSIKISGGKISDTIYSGKDVIFELGESSLTVKNAKNKNIDITVSNGSSASWFIDDDNNFISDDANIDSITQENYSVTNIETSNFDTFTQDKNILTFTDKK